MTPERSDQLSQITLPEHRPRLLYVGEVPIRNDASGGSIVLWRHQQLLKGFLLEEQIMPLWKPGWASKFIGLLRRCRLNRLLMVIQPWLLYGTHRISEACAQRIKKQYAGILTVAHGVRWLEAMQISAATGLPLISIFHDWYPDASGCPYRFTQFWDQWFRRLYRQSNLAFVVSEGMARELGPHPNVHLLPPIPSIDVSVEEWKTSSAGRSLTFPVKMYYAGFAGGLYQPLLIALIKAIRNDPRFQLRISGSDTETLPRGNPGEGIEVLGFLNGEAWEKSFKEADLLLVVLSFDTRSRRLLRTHFPSKLVEYAIRGRPILIWGPEESSAVQWARKQADGIVCTKPSAKELLETVIRASDSCQWEKKALRPELGRDSGTTCDAQVIQQIFEQELERLPHLR
jgi:hypothetical protein